MIHALSLTYPLSFSLSLSLVLFLFIIIILSHTRSLVCFSTPPSHRFVFFFLHHRVVLSYSFWPAHYIFLIPLAYIYTCEPFGMSLFLSLSLFLSYRCVFIFSIRRFRSSPLDAFFSLSLSSSTDTTRVFLFLSWYKARSIECCDQSQNRQMRSMRARVPIYYTPRDDKASVLKEDSSRKRCGYI